jgi:biotin transport system substrate-specific component
MAHTIASTSAASATSRTQSLLRHAGLVIAATVVIAICAHIALPLPWTPIPLVAQDLAVLVVGLLFGPQLGFATLVLYLAEGAAGLPMFNPHGPGGIAQIIGPTGGFLMAYPVVAAIAGFLRSRTGNYAKNLAAAAIATTVLFTSGALYFAALLHTGVSITLHSAVTPFLPGAVLKCALAAGIATTWTKTKSSRSRAN